MLILDFIYPSKSFFFSTGTYDAIFMMGVFGPAHVDFDNLPEVIRMTKKGTPLLQKYILT